MPGQEGHGPVAGAVAAPQGIQRAATPIICLMLALGREEQFRPTAADGAVPDGPRSERAGVGVVDESRPRSRTVGSPQRQAVDRVDRPEVERPSDLGQPVGLGGPAARVQVAHERGRLSEGARRTRRCHDCEECHEHADATASGGPPSSGRMHAPSYAGFAGLPSECRLEMAGHGGCPRPTGRRTPTLPEWEPVCVPYGGSHPENHAPRPTMRPCRWRTDTGCHATHGRWTRPSPSS